MNYLAVSVGAVPGANARYILGGWLSERLGSSFPWSTLILNVTGSFSIGLVLGLAALRVTPSWWRTGLAIGFLGSYTTFWTFSYGTVSLLREGSFATAALNMGGSVAAALAATLIGLAVAQVV